MELDIEEIGIVLAMCVVCLVLGALSFVAGVYAGWAL